jgi:hypothetical protein
VFLLALFLIKTGFLSKNTFSFASDKEGLTYSTATIGGLVSRDSDGDGIPDWEENLWGTDPLKRETTPGIPDSSVINKLKAEQGGYSLEGEYESEDLTETDKFSRELFSTIATLSQAGAVDEEVAEKITSSLAEQIQNPTQKKIYTLSDIKITSDDSVTATKKYNDTLDDIIEKKYPIKGNILEILTRFIVDENNVDSSVLAEIEPIIEQRNKIIEAIVQTEVPQALSVLHLDLINALQKYSETLKGLTFFESDPIVTLGAISQFEETVSLMESAVTKLKEAIEEKLGN